MLRKKLFGNPSTNSIKEENKRRKTDDQTLDLSVKNCEVADISKYFPNLDKSAPVKIEDEIIRLQNELNKVLRTLNFKAPPIAFVYNPLEYALRPHENYVRKFCTSKKKIIFVGMNPGPYGMCQTGVPFGDPKWVKEWLKIEGEVFKPDEECPERKIFGLESPRKEQSGDRFWGYFASICNQPEEFFKHSYVYNFCPLAFMKKDGCNVTPNEIKDAQVRRELENICGGCFVRLLDLLEPDIIISVGSYVDRKIKDLFKTHNITNINILCLPHPSPRALNNTNWPEKAEHFLATNDLKQYFEPSNGQ
nr:unnamed protein product [Callosobruchus chinensis]